MIIQNKRTKQIDNVSIDAWNRMKENQLDRFWLIIENDDIPIKSNLDIETFIQKKSDAVIAEDNTPLVVVKTNPKPKKRKSTKK
jgi:hypothetical protein